MKKLYFLIITFFLFELWKNQYFGWIWSIYYSIFFLYKFKDLLDIKNRDVLPIQKSIFSKFGKFKLFNYETYK